MNKLLVIATLLLLPVSFAEQNPFSNFGTAFLNNTKTAVVDSAKKTAFDSLAPAGLGNSQLAQQPLTWNNLSNLPATTQTKIQEIYNSFLKESNGNIEQARSKTLTYIQNNLQNGTAFLNPTTPSTLKPGAASVVDPTATTVSSQKFEAIKTEEAKVIDTVPTLDKAK